jgi:formylglycine-generating enzyme required for sulfatase activity
VPIQSEEKNMQTLIQSGFSTLLDDVVISDATAQKAISLFKEHFTFTADEISKAYQDSYGYAITAISVGLAIPDQKLAFVQKICHSKITREFADPIEIKYFQPFAEQHRVESETLLRKHLISELNQIAKYKDQLFQIKQITQEDLAALITYKGSVAITELVLEQIRLITPVDDTLVAFLSQDDLLGKALLYFFHEIIRKDQRVEKIQAALQREGLCIEVRELQAALKTAEDNLNQAIAEQSSQFLEIVIQQQNLQQAQSAWQSRSELLTSFPAWADLLNCQLEHLLDFVTQIPEQLEKVHQDAEIAIKNAKGELFEFEIVTVNADGKITERLRKDARYQTEDLGNGVVLEMVSIPGGTFMMGSPETEMGREERESPQHEVTVEPFYMGKYLVTQAQWEEVMGNNPSRFKGKNRPVEQVSWKEAVRFCNRLSKMTGKTYRLPSEAEWEYACRAGTTTPFYFGETITTDLANYRGTNWIYKGTIFSGSYGSGPKGVFYEETTEVGSFPPNAFGLYDMHGNVWEWCADPWHKSSYEGAPNDESVWEGSSRYRMVRGGSWFNLPSHARTAFRVKSSSIKRYGTNGFRVVLSVE